MQTAGVGKPPATHQRERPMRQALAACIVAAWGCGDPIGPSQEANDTLLADVTDDTGGSDDTSAGDTYPVGPLEDTAAATDDEELVRRLIAGAVDREVATQAIAWSDGFPVQTADGGIIFVFDGTTQPVLLAGDHNGWIPEPMTPGDGLSWLEVKTPLDPGSAYKFVLPGDVYVADSLARAYIYDDNGELSYAVPPTETSRIERWPGLEHAGLEPRNLRVLVPPGPGPWPTLLVHDGQDLFDPNAAFGGLNLRATADALTRPVLIVGIDNTAARLAEYSHVDDRISGDTITSVGGAYAELVHASVRPHIDRRYPTSGVWGLMGTSLGGLMSLAIADRYPDAYDFCASLSGTLGWGAYNPETDAPMTMRRKFQTTAAAGGNTALTVYVDSGGSDGDGRCDDVDGDGEFEDDPNDSDNYCVTRHFADVLAESGYSWDVTLHHWWEPGAAHNQTAWAARIARPLSLFLDLAGQ